MPRLIPYAIILILAGVIIGLNIQATPAPQPASMLPSQNVGIKPNIAQQLKTQLNELNNHIESLEIKLRKAQEKNINMLSKLSASQQALKQNLAALTHINSNNAEEKQTSISQINNGLNISDVNAPKLTEAQRNKNILLTMGIDEEDATRIQNLAEKKEMDQLYLRNTAAREGWFGTEKYFEKTRELDLASNIYREELGDDKYDQFLYSSQLTNRITIQSVLSGSPAENSGLQSGDYILSYGNQRVFNWSDLTSLTANGEAGENVTIEVERDGQIIQYIIARGPLGIRLSSERVKPNT